MNSLQRIRGRVVPALLGAAMLLVPLAGAVAGTTSWPQDTNLVVGPYNLVVVAPSSSDSLSIDPSASTLTVTVAAAETFKLRYPGPNAGTLANNGGLGSCNIVGGNNDVTVTGPATVIFTPNGTLCGQASGGGSSSNPTATLSLPNGGETLVAGASYQVFWGAGGTGVQTIRLKLSTDSGLTYAIIADGEFNDGVYDWTVPSIATTTARVKVEAMGSGSVLASDDSNADFTITVPSSGGGGGGGGTSTTTPPPTTTTPPTTTEPTPGPAPRVTVQSPNGGETYAGGSGQSASWLVESDETIAAVTVGLSVDGGRTYLLLYSGAIKASHAWIVPPVATTEALLKVTAKTASGASGSDVSNAFFTITSAGEGTVILRTVFTDAASSYPKGDIAPTPLTDAEKAAPLFDTNVSGTYTAGGAVAATPTIDIDKGVLPPPPEVKLPCVGGSLIKIATNASVYYCGKNGKRFVFPNQRIYSTWYPDFKSVKTITLAEMIKIPIGGNITYKPGVKMVKIQTDPRVYAIARDGLLRWVKDEAAAAKLYGPLWNKYIDDVPDSFFFNYKIGDPIQ